MVGAGRLGSSLFPCRDEPAAVDGHAFVMLAAHGTVPVNGIDGSKIRTAFGDR